MVSDVVERESDLQRVGRCGELHLDFAVREGITELAHARCTSPWHYVPPSRLEKGGGAYTLLVNPSGGLVGGDRLSCSVTLGEHGHLLLSTPSANRVYRTTGAWSEQHVVLHLHQGSWLEWMPEVTIPFAGSRFRQQIHATLASGATLVLWDALAAGRIAKGERWMLDEYVNDIEIRAAGGTRLIDRSRLVPQEWSRSAGGMGDWNYVGALYAISDHRDEACWNRLQARLIEVAHELDTRILSGISRPSVSGLVIKCLACSAPELQECLERQWHEIRVAFGHQGCPALRRY